MYPVPTGKDPNGLPIPFSAVLGSDHTVRITSQLENGDGDILVWQFGIESGSITVDKSAQFRRSLKMEVTAYGAAGLVVDNSTGQLQQLAGSLIPKDGSDSFAPYGNKVRLWYSVEVPGYVSPLNGTNMYDFELGVYRLASAEVADDGTPKLSVTAYDDSRTISRNKLTSPWIVAAGTNYGDAIIALCSNRLPGLLYNTHTITDTTPQIIVDPESDPWKTVTDWAATIGYQVYFDRYGYLTQRPEPDPTTDPVVWVYDDGETNPNAVLLSAGRTMSDDPGYNGIILTSESNTLTAPIRVELWDDDPDSPTYALGSYGKVPYFLSSALVTDYTGGGNMAASELKKVMGGTEMTEFSCIPNPAHEAGDVVRVVRPLSRTDATAVIDSMEIPLTVDSPMNIRTLERRSSAQISGTLL